MKDGEKLVESALERLRAAIEQGNSERFKEYLRAIRQFPRYSAGNVLLIVVQRPDSTHVAGFHTWRRIGRRVRKGEKAIKILAPIMRRANPKGHEDDEERIAGFRAVNVFDVSHTEGETLPEPVQVAGDPASALPRLHVFAMARGIQVQYANDRLDGAMGVSLGGRIILRCGMSPAEEVSTLAYEP